MLVVSVLVCSYKHRFPQRQEKGADFPGIGGIGRSELPHGPLQEQPAFNY